MDKSAIIEEIEAIVKRAGVSYSSWTIGVTDDTVRRKDEHSKDHKVTSWRDWNADSEKDAREIEEYFKDKGMKGGLGGPGSADYVYIF